MARSPVSRCMTVGLVKLSPTRPIWRSTAELLAVEGDDAGRFLAAVLQRVQAERGQRAPPPGGPKCRTRRTLRAACRRRRDATASPACAPPQSRPAAGPRSAAAAGSGRPARRPGSVAGGGAPVAGIALGGAGFRRRRPRRLGRRCRACSACLAAQPLHDLRLRIVRQPVHQVRAERIEPRLRSSPWRSIPAACPGAMKKLRNRTAMTTRIRPRAAPKTKPSVRSSGPAASRARSRRCAS